MKGRRLEEVKSFFTKKKLLRAAMILCAVVMLGSILYIGRYYYYVIIQKGQQKDLNQRFDDAMINSPENSPEILPPETETPVEPTEETDPIPELGEWQKERARLRELDRLGREKFADLLEINPDFLGRVSIPGLIDNPLVFVHSQDNEDYLFKGFDGKYSPLGTVFLSSDNDSLMMDNNIALYGHNMGSGDMFAAITKYKKAATFKSNPLILLEGLPEDSAWVVFASYVTEPEWGFKSPVRDADDFSKLLEEIAARSWFTTDVEVNESDRILTLVTCDYTYEDMRFVVHARKLRPGETSPESVTAAENPNRKPANIPSQKRLAEITASRTAVLMRPGNNKLYFYQPREGGIDWYAGNTSVVQGLYSNYTGKISKESFLAAVYDGEESRLYLASDKFNGQKGIALFSSYSPSGPLSSHGRVTPEGVDARYPALIVDNGTVWLFYSVADSGTGEVSLYRLKIQERKASGSPELLMTAGAGARPLGRFAINGVPVLLWHEGAKVYGMWDGGDKFETALTGDAARVTLYGTVSEGRVRAVVEKNGKLSFHSLQLTPPPPETSPSPVETASADPEVTDSTLPIN